ncbi:MAG: ribonucleoside-diphosphate reductase alpha chain [Planctomycetota bacterium]|jgi:ribonucleoside-diphosphate reductase alpha chain
MLTSGPVETGHRVLRRNGEITAFDPNKISVAITKAFLAVEGDAAADSGRIHDSVKRLTNRVVERLMARVSDDAVIHIEDIQDRVELALMRSGDHKVARAFVIYREAQNRKRDEEELAHPEGEPVIGVLGADGVKRPLNRQALRDLVFEACSGFEGVDPEFVISDTTRHLFDGISVTDVSKALVLSARTLVDKEPSYSEVAARLLLDILRNESLNFLGLKADVHTQAAMVDQYGEYFRAYLRRAADLELVDDRLNAFDMDRIVAAIKPERDLNFTYLGLQTLYDRYFIHNQDGIRFEMPQAFFMRVAMGLALSEDNREARAIEFYNLLSTFRFMSSTPTLFNSGTLRPQLSSCFLTTLPDDLGGIYSSIKDNAMLSKFAGGLGNDWTPVRGLGSYIKGTNGSSQGVVPFLKVANDTAVAVNQGGKRKGAVCAYLETWHLDIEEFLELRKNTGDERRRTHDMNTASWIPDLFMKRVVEDKPWSLFSPNETPDLHGLVGKAFEKRYTEYEAMAERGELRTTRQVQAVDLWRRMLGMVFETGHPWITFKDPCNIRYTNQHVGVVHSSNLCTEITLHTNADEIAVCNLGSVNLPAHIKEHGLDLEMLEETVTTAMRMLDNVIEYNYYSVPQAKNSNIQHRPVGLGIMGFQDALYKQAIPYASEKAVEFADRSMEAVSYYAIQASTDLAEERGKYETYEGSLWSRGILPIDSLQMMIDDRGGYIQVDNSRTFDWDLLRERVQTVGMRNSNTMAIAPTATISNICGVSQSIEPTYQNIYAKSNLSGEFTVVNTYLIRDLKARGLWDDVMINDLNYYDGSVQEIERVPDDIKELYTTAFDMDARWLIEAGSRRQKWIDQAQSLNLYMKEPSGKKLDSLYRLAWARGLKTTYYLRSMGASANEKSSESRTVEAEAPSACSILEPDCEACQ